MKKLISILVLSLTFFACNPEGNDPGQSGTIVGTYKLGTLVITSNIPGVQTGAINNSCVKESTLIIDANNGFTITRYSLNSTNDCVISETDSGSLVNVGTYFFSRRGQMEFVDTAKNCDFIASGTEQGIGSFGYRYTIVSSTNSAQSTTYDFLFSKVN